jgi:hypothetical protein
MMFGASAAPGRPSFPRGESSNTNAGQRAPRGGISQHSAHCFYLSISLQIDPLIACRAQPSKILQDYQISF